MDVALGRLQLSRIFKYIIHLLIAIKHYFFSTSTSMANIQLSVEEPVSSSAVKTFAHEIWIKQVQFDVTALLLFFFCGGGRGGATHRLEKSYLKYRAWGHFPANLNVGSFCLVSDNIWLNMTDWADICNLCAWSALQMCCEE